MKLKLLKISKDKLTHLENDEKVFYLYMGHLRNELTMIQGVLNLSTSFTHENEFLSSTNSSMSLLVVRLLAGKLNEGWVFLEKAYYGKRISQNIQSKLQPDSITALSYLKQYFKRNQNSIHKVRNNFAFHYSVENHSEILSKLDNLDNLDIFITEKEIPFFIFAEQIISEIMYEEMNNSNPEQALENFIEETFRVAQKFKLFCDGCLANMIDNSQPHPTKTIEIDIPDSENQLKAPIVFNSSKFLF